MIVYFFRTRYASIFSPAAVIIITNSGNARPRASIPSGR
jgi:hypothetical protein